MYRYCRIEEWLWRESFPWFRIGTQLGDSDAFLPTEKTERSRAPSSMHLRVSDYVQVLYPCDYSHRIYIEIKIVIFVCFCQLCELCVLLCSMGPAIMNLEPWTTSGCFRCHERMGTPILGPWVLIPPQWRICTNSSAYTPTLMSLPVWGLVNHKLEVDPCHLWRSASCCDTWITTDHIIQPLAVSDATHLRMIENQWDMSNSHGYRSRYKYRYSATHQSSTTT